MFARLGKETDLVSALDLHTLVGDPDPEVREATVDLINSWGFYDGAAAGGAGSAPPNHFLTAYADAAAYFYGR